MQTKDLPFNISIMNVTKDRVKTLKPVRSTDIMGSSGQALTPSDKASPITDVLSWGGEKKLSSNFHEDGLFSTSIFGRIGDEERDKRFSFIDIKTTIFHPIIYKALTKLNKLYGSIMLGKERAVWDAKEKNFVLSDSPDAETGFAFFIKHWADIKFVKNRSPVRTERIKLIEKYKDSALTTRIIVIPAGLRDVRVGSGNRLEFDEVNDYYRKIVGISNTINTTGENLDSPVLNYARSQLQYTFNSLYEHLENMLKGKKGFMLGKWAKRKVFNGTRNIISSMNTSKAVLGDPNEHKTTDTIIGLFQTMRGVLPKTLHYLRNGYIADAMGLGDVSNTVTLVDPTTLKKELVELNPKTRDRWSTIDGLEKVINNYEDIENRGKPVMIEGRYLALIYKGPDKTFKVFNDIGELPENLDKSFVKPITLVELLYLSGYRYWNDNKAVITRYPVTGLGSVYPTDIFVKTTATVETRTELDESWEPMGDNSVAKAFPIVESNQYFDSVNVSPVRIGGLGADFDGDSISVLLLYSKNSIEEVKRALGSRKSYIDASGGLRTSVKVDILNLTVYNMSVTDVKEYK